MMLQVRTCLLFVALSTAAFGDVDYSKYARLLETYVVGDGVRYEAWANNSEDVSALDALMEEFAEVRVPALDLSEQKAFYINLYNAGMLQAVLDHYPIQSVKEIGLVPFSVFKETFIRQGDRKLSLDDVEKGILLKNYFDPRIHFAVNCASESCPPLLDVPFTGEALDRQLDGQTRAFARSGRAARVDQEKEAVAYSELFSWYADDFPGENPATYLNEYRDDPLPLGFSVKWISYDWSLNIAR